MQTLPLLLCCMLMVVMAGHGSGSAPVQQPTGSPIIPLTHVGHSTVVLCLHCGCIERFITVPIETTPSTLHADACSHRVPYAILCTLYCDSRLLRFHLHLCPQVCFELVGYPA